MKIKDLIGKTIQSIEYTNMFNAEELASYGSPTVITFTDGTKVELEVTDPGSVWVTDLT